MSSFILFIAFMTGVTVTFVIFSHEFYHILKAESANRVHFYAARDESGELYLYLGKPIRRREAFYTDDKSVIIPFSSRYLKKIGFNKEDFKSLKWEDEPVEVFLNMKD